VRAVQLVEWEREPAAREVERPRPGAGEVLLAVDAAGLCHSDIHVMDRPAGRLPWTLPFTLGHEIAGTVAALGPGVRGLEEGDRVVVYGPWGCGTCRQCARGAENYCERLAELDGRGCGLGFDGGLADYLLVPQARWLVPIGDLDPVQAAPLTDAGLTSYHAIAGDLRRLRPGSAAVVIGVGGLGHLAVQMLRALSSARIVAVDARERSRALARESGADAVLDAGATVADVRAETGAAGADLVLDFVATDATLQLAAGVLAVAGHATMIGLGGGTFPMAFGSVPFGASVSRPSWGTLPELRDVVALARAGALEVEVERLGLDETLEGYRRLREGEVFGRAVVVP
jgi:alcohol dehydrogenase, propanol-preferring